MDNITHKQCSKCREYKSLENFWNNRRMKDGLNGQCKDCVRAYWQQPEIKERTRISKKEWGQRRPYNSAKQRNSYLRKAYGLTFAQYDEMYNSQDGKCLICNKTLESSKGGRSVHIDHDHKTGKIRGLLCQHCNNMLGHAFDNTDVLSSAIAYLNHHLQ
jgi:hypothetical protein